MYTGVGDSKGPWRVATRQAQHEYDELMKFACVYMV